MALPQLPFDLSEQAMTRAIDWVSDEINAFENTKANKKGINICLRPEREPGGYINHTADSVVEPIY